MSNILPRATLVRIINKLQRELKFTEIALGNTALIPQNGTLKGKRIFVYPPEEKIETWVKVASTECRCQNTLIVMLLPSKTSSRWFQDYICSKPGIIVRFIDGDALPNNEHYLITIFSNARRKFIAESWIL